MTTETNTISARSVAVIVFTVFLLAVSISACHAVSVHRGDDTNFTLIQSGNENFYYLTMDGDDHFADYLETGSCNNAEFNQYLMDNVTCGKGLSKFSGSNCSAFITGNSNGEGYLVGRNYDFSYSMPCAVFCKGNGSDTYSSVSTTDLGLFCDRDEPYTCMVKDTRLNAASYIPLDGINEKGVFICINSVNKGPAVDQHREGMTDIFVTSCLRVVLNYADSAAEGAELISNLNLHGKADFHMFVCDNTGEGYAVEIYGSETETYVTETKLLTNHYLTEEGKDVPVTESSISRFNTLKETMKESMDRDQVKAALISVKQENPDHHHFTRWSVIYDLDAQNVVIYLRVGEEMDYDRGHEYSLNATAVP